MASEIDENIARILVARSRIIKDPAKREVRILEDVEALKIVDELRLSVHQIYKAALRADVYPYRYLRNREAITREEQLQLAESRVAVIGSGGLGGHVILLLARIGIGRLTVVDYDIFDETNLNRQALSSQKAIGRPKCQEAVDVVAAINPGVEVLAYQVKLNAADAVTILNRCHVVVDALDNVSDRFILEEAAKKIGIPMVHGALAGFEGQLMTIFPGDPGLINLYGSREGTGEKSKSPEAILGVPTLMPCLLATLQAMEVVKIILKRGKILRNVMVHADLETGQLNEFRFG